MRESPGSDGSRRITWDNECLDCEGEKELRARRQIVVRKSKELVA
jgi:hypothetical protein